MFSCLGRMCTMKFFSVSAIFVILLCVQTSSQNTTTNKINGVENELVIHLTELFEKIGNVTNTTDTPTICKECELVIEDFIKFRKSGASKASIIQYLSKLCILLMGYLPSVCQVFSEIEADVIIYIVDNKDVKPQDICGVYYQNHGCINPHAKKWTISIPPVAKYTNKATNLTNADPLKIVQITDVHYDPLYKAGSNAKCDLPLCCEGKSGLPSDPKNAAGLFGDYQVCDMPKNAVVNLLTEIKKSQKKLDYVYFTGDIIAHKNWETSKESNLETIKEFYDFLFKYLGEVQVYPILGNHEAHPCNLYAPLNISSASKVGTQWLFDAVADYWSKWLPQSALDTVKLGGYYTVLVRPGFRIIGLNSNVCFTENFWLFYDDEDPYQQLKWLVQVLLEAEKKGEKIHILSHIPPGEAMCHRQWQYNFNKIVQRFAKIITAHFNGHTHVDEFRIYKNESNPDQAVNVAYNGGSFTTFVGLNPDYRVYEVDPRNLMVSDYHQYIFNLSLANSNENKDPEWYKLYSFKSAYEIDNLNYDSLLDLNKRLGSDPKLAQQYVQFHVRDSEFAFKDGCNETCIHSQICHITAIDADDSIECGAYTVFN